DGIRDKLVTGVQTCALPILAIAFYSVSGLAYLYFGSWPVTHQDFWQLYQRALTHSWLQSALLKYGPHSIFFPSFFWLTDLRFFRSEERRVGKECSFMWSWWY